MSYYIYKIHEKRHICQIPNILENNKIYKLHQNMTNMSKNGLFLSYSLLKTTPLMISIPMRYDDDSTENSSCL